MPLAIALVKEGCPVRGATTSREKLSFMSDQGIDPFLLMLNPHAEGDRIAEFFSSEILIINIPPRRKSQGEENFLLQMREVQRHCTSGGVKHVVFVSSTSVYADIDKVVLEEDADPSSYMKHAEDIISASEQFSTTIIRFGGLVGPGRHPGRFFSERPMTGADVPVNVIHLEDCINVIVKIIATDCWGMTLNACADHHPTKFEFYSRAASLLGLAPPNVIATDQSYYKIVDSSKLKETLRYTFRYPDPMSMEF